MNKNLTDATSTGRGSPLLRNPLEIEPLYRWGELRHVRGSGILEVGIVLLTQGYPRTKADHHPPPV